MYYCESPSNAPCATIFFSTLLTNQKHSEHNRKYKLIKVGAINSVILGKSWQKSKLPAVSVLEARKQSMGGNILLCSEPVDVSLPQDGSPVCPRLARRTASVSQIAACRRFSYKGKKMGEFCWYQIDEL